MLNPATKIVTAILAAQLLLNLLGRILHGRTQRGAAG